uniref:Uncharacterized protein n=1 Tax=viral metagenome TaxID=1070528 RepID=A0A6M3J0B3_9ZZZZ
MAFYGQSPYDRREARRDEGRRTKQADDVSDGTTPATGQCVEGKQCAGDADCPGGKCVGRVVDPTTKRITPGKCSCAGTTPTTDTGCPEGTGRAYEGCACGEVYGTFTGKCASGYQFQKIAGPEDLTKDGATYTEGMIGRCVCTKAISDWKAGQTTQTGLGEYQWPSELLDIYGRLMGKAGDILDMPYGYSPEALRTWFGQDFEKMRGTEAGTRETLLKDLGRAGQLGTGTALERLGKGSWETEKNVSDLMRDIFLQNELMKRSDLTTQTGLAQSLFGTGVGVEQALEAINAARRGEGQNALALLMAYITQLMSSWGG